jgi:hypothetical protein
VRSRAAAVPAALVLLVAGCTDSGSGASSSDDEGTSSGGASSPVAAEPGDGLTVVADEDPVAQAVSTSRALFESSPVAVLVRADDRAGQLLGASAAVRLDQLVETPVVPAFEVIVTVASEFAGPDGNYSTESPVETVRPWVEAAGAAGLYVILDLQPGRTDFVAQAELYRSLLELPYVGLALDPEWRLAPDEVHLTQIGSVAIEEVNRVVTWLADLTREKALPQKLLVLHQFRLDMLPGREFLDLSRDELAIMIHADGQGPQGSKQATWSTLRQGAPDELAWGWKNFYDEDAPMLTPEQTIQQVLPTPELVTYQ